MLMNKKTPKFIDELLKNETLKEPLKEAIMLLAMKYDTSYYFFDKSKKQFEFIEDLKDQLFDQIHLSEKNQDAIIKDLQNKIQEIGQSKSDFADAQKEINSLKKTTEELNNTIENIKKQFQNSKELLKQINESEEVINKDHRFIAYKDGTILDTKKGFMWANSANDMDINWHDAKKYCENYCGGGYTDWRMPTIDELEDLYKSSSSLFKPINYYIWSQFDINSDSAFIFHMENGKSSSTIQSYSSHKRAFPVRNNKPSKHEELVNILLRILNSTFGD